MVHSLLRSMRWSPRKDDTLGCTRNALDNKYFPVSWFYLLLGTWELLAMGHSSSGWSQDVNANTWRMYIHNSTSGGRCGRVVWGCRRKGMCLCFANCICTQSLSKTHRTEIWVGFSQSSSPPKEAFDFTILINVVSHTNTQRWRVPYP